jgi:hypothetical protein
MTTLSETKQWEKEFDNFNLAYELINTDCPPGMAASKESEVKDFIKALILSEREEAVKEFARKAKEEAIYNHWILKPKKVRTK